METVMGTKNKPGQFNCYAAAGDDEPMFVLLARDQEAPLLVELWANVRQRLGEEATKVAEARRCAADMTAWRRVNEGLKLASTRAMSYEESIRPMLMRALGHAVDDDVAVLQSHLMTMNEYERRALGQVADKVRQLLMMYDTVHRR